MAASEMVRARVDRDTARKVKAWAKANETDVSTAVRTALERLIRQWETDQRIREEIRREFDTYERQGLFDPPRGPWKAGGFR